MAENIKDEHILITGNTVIDALLDSSKRVFTLDNKEIDDLKKIIDPSKKIILVTGHRRENHGLGFMNICEALKEIALKNKDVQIIYPVHLNPNVQKPVHQVLSETKNIHLISPLSYPAFVWLMNISYIIIIIIITDSGGIQEEAPSLGKPVLVLRDVTERPEAVEAEIVILVGADKRKIVKETNSLLSDDNHYQEMSALKNPYGDGLACQRIVKFMKLN